MHVIRVSPGNIGKEIEHAKQIRCALEFLEQRIGLNGELEFPKKAVSAYIAERFRLGKSTADSRTKEVLEKFRAKRPDVEFNLKGRGLICIRSQTPPKIEPLGVDWNIAQDTHALTDESTISAFDADPIVNEDDGRFEQEIFLEPLPVIPANPHAVSGTLQRTPEKRLSPEEYQRIGEKKQNDFHGLMSRLLKLLLLHCRSLLVANCRQSVKGDYQDQHGEDIRLVFIFRASRRRYLKKWCIYDVKCNELDTIAANERLTTFRRCKYQRSASYVRAIWVNYRRRKICHIIAEVLHDLKTHRILPEEVDTDAILMNFD